MLKVYLKCRKTLPTLRTLEAHGMKITNRQKFLNIILLLVSDLFNLTLRPGLIIPQTSDDSLFEYGINKIR